MRTEILYAQTEKELLSICFALERFESYLCLKRITV